MEGRPWLRIFLVLVAFSLLGFPIWKTTQSNAVTIPAKEKATILEQPLHIEISFAEPPASFDLEYLGTILCKGTAPQRDFSCDERIKIPKEGIDLFLNASWPEGSPKTAVRVQAFRNSDLLIDQTFWALDNLAEVITISGKEP